MSRAADLALETLGLEQEGRVLTARVDQPPFNYMTGELLGDLDELTRAVDRDDSVGAVVLTGSAADRFITHFDISEMLEGSERAGRSFPEPVTRTAVRGVQAAQRVPGGERAVEALPFGGLVAMRRFAATVLRIERSSSVYIAAINGPCGGGGMELALWLDLRLAADRGVVLGLPELLIGLTTSVGGRRLAQVMGPARALELVLEGRLMGPHEAVEAGLVHHVVSREELLDVARERARRYARRHPDTVAAQKRILFEHSLRPADQCLRLEAAANLAAITSDPTRRALRTFLEAQEREGGESAFLVDHEAWAEGRAVDLAP
jgi:enoyl-CoA hydratase